MRFGASKATGDLVSLTQQLLESHRAIKAKAVEAVTCAWTFLHMKFSQSTYLDSIIILLIAGIEVMYQLIESVYSYCLLPARTLRRQSHTHIRVHTCTPPCHTCCYCVTRSRCEADTCSDMMVSVEVVTLAVCRLPQWELVESGKDWTEQKPFEGLTLLLL